MFPERFDYYRAETVEEALDLIAEHGDVGGDVDGDVDADSTDVPVGDSSDGTGGDPTDGTDGDPADDSGGVELLAGGHSLVPAMKNEGRSPDAVVHLAVDDLDGVRTRDGGVLIGALTTYADLATDETVAERAPLIASAAGEVGDLQIRNRGTLGGNVAEAHPGADPPAAVLAADATLLVRGTDGEREIPAGSFFEGHGETAVAAGELVTAVRVPDQRDVGTAYVRKTHPTTGYALVGVAAVVDVTDSVVADARVAATGVVDRAVRLPSVEDELRDSAADLGSVERAAAVAAANLDDERLRSDPYASGAFRANVLESVVEEALTSAVERASVPAGP